MKARIPTVPMLVSALLVGQAMAQITRNPYLQNLSQTGTEVMWGLGQTDANTGTVYYGTEPGVYTHSVASSNIYGVNTATISGLSGGQTMYYYVDSAGRIVGQNDPNYRFTTAPAGNASFRFAAYGDSRTNATAHAGVVSLIQSYSPDLVVHTGDYSSVGLDVQYNSQFFAPAAPLLRNTPMFTTRGNHDTSVVYDYVFDTPANNPEGSEWYYSFDYGAAHFVSLDTPALVSGNGAAETAWLQADLAANTKPWTFVFFHHPPFSSGSHGDTLQVQQQWLPIFEQYNVTMAFSGHDHIYDAYLKDDVYYIVTGGGGAPLYSAGPNPPYQIFNDYAIGYHAVVLDVTQDSVVFRGVDQDGVFHTIVIPEPGVMVLFVGATALAALRRRLLR
jgi:hypothetical protein